MSYRFVIYILISLLVIIPNIKAEEDQVYFYNLDREKVEKPIIYVGEDGINFLVFFGNNCSNYSIEVSSPLFLYQIRGIHYKRINASRRSCHHLDLNPNAPVGKYFVTFYLNYTLDNNTKVHKQFNLTVEYKRSYDLKKVNLPTNADKTFSLKVQTYTEFDKLKVKFNTDGDISLEKQEIVLENISAGNYTFRTKVWQQNSPLPMGAQELGYSITGYIGEHIIYQSENNIPVVITWDNETKSKEKENTYVNTAIIIILVIVIGSFGYYWYYKKKTL